jgi:small-conductance mechanosensitive channel
MNLDLEQFNQVVAYGWIPAQAVLFLLASFVGARLVLNWSTRAMRRAHIDVGTQILIKRALVVGWILVTVLWLLGILGVNPAGLVAVAGTFAVAFSLAIQDILKNVFTGVYLLLERPFRVGDTIRVKDQTGVVENIGLRTTQLRTNDNVQVMVPNATVFGEVVANQTYQRPTGPAEVAADGHSEADQAKTRA